MILHELFSLCWVRRRTEANCSALTRDSAASICGSLNSLRWQRPKAAGRLGAADLSPRDRSSSNQWRWTIRLHWPAGVDPGARYVRAILYMDYGARAAAYVDAFMAAINWSNVARCPHTSLGLTWFRD